MPKVYLFKHISTWERTIPNTFCYNEDVKLIMELAKINNRVSSWFPYTLWKFNLGQKGLLRIVQKNPWYWFHNFCYLVFAESLVSEKAQYSVWLLSDSKFTFLASWIALSTENPQWVNKTRNSKIIGFFITFILS